MKVNLMLLVLIVSLFSCSNWTKEKKQEKLEIENDSLMIVLDSIMEIHVKIPELIDSSFIAIECLDQFSKLARETEGEIKVVSSSKFVAKEIVEIIESNLLNGSDLMIVIDKTSSMADDIENIKKGLKQILGLLKKYKDIRLSVATYGDKNIDGNLWFEFKNFESDFSSTMKFIREIETTGGGDFPESVYDGIYEAFDKGFWNSNTKRIVVLLGDAPSLDSTKSEHTIDEIIEISTIQKINMNFYPIVLSSQDLGFVMDISKMQNLTFIETVYPNPSRGKFTLKLNQLGNFKFELFNQNGILIKAKQLTSDSYSDNLYDYPNGLYVIRVSDENKNYDTRKIIVNR
ncbi:MAG: T9SS type A sorting domain-containing protein [Saprospiraceae bacterium]